MKPVEIVNFEKGVFSEPASTSFKSGPVIIPAPASAAPEPVPSTPLPETDSATDSPLSPSALDTPAKQELVESDSPLFPSSKVFKHELLQSFSFHLFAKRPIEPIVSELALKRELMRRMTLSALQIRLNVQQRNEPLFTFVDFNQQNWPREGCAVCSLDLTTDINVSSKLFISLYFIFVDSLFFVLWSVLEKGGHLSSEGDSSLRVVRTNRQ